MGKALASILRRVLVEAFRELAPDVAAEVWRVWWNPCRRLAAAIVRRERAYLRGWDVRAWFWGLRVAALRTACEDRDGACRVPIGMNCTAADVAERVARATLRALEEKT